MYYVSTVGLNTATIGSISESKKRRPDLWTSLYLKNMQILLRFASSQSYWLERSESQPSLDGWRSYALIGFSHTTSFGRCLDCNPFYSWSPIVKLGSPARINDSTLYLFVSSVLQATSSKKYKFP